MIVLGCIQILLTKNKKVNIPKDYINILFCNNCYLVQLDRNYDLKYMFNSNYGYRSGINNTMSTHLKNLASTISKNFNLKKNLQMACDTNRIDNFSRLDNLSLR